MEEKVFCPNCGSRDAEPRHDQLWGFTKSPNIWECKNCGYTGLMPQGDPREDDAEFEPGDEYPLETRTGTRNWYVYLGGAAVFFGIFSLVFLAASVLLGNV